MTAAEQPAAAGRRVSFEAGLPALWSFPREEFLVRRWHYGDGEHTTFLGPTQCGKTTLAFQLLDRVATSRKPAVVLVMKPRDPIPARWGKALGFRTVRSWPPVRNPVDWSPRGYLLWPRHVFDPDRDDAVLYTEFRKAILDNYKRGGRITFGDEVWGLAKELRLTRELQAVWSRGAGMGNALWSATQRPREIPLMAYSQAEHIFVAYTPDEADRDRYSEIGGVNPRIVKAVTAALPKYHWLYIRRTNRAMCIIEP